MNRRQAISAAILRAKRLALLLALLALLAIITACSPSNQPLPTYSPTPFPPSPTLETIPSPTPTLTPTPVACRAVPGRIEEGKLDSFNPAQEFRIYLPPCYDEFPGQRYPVLYLIHGQTYNDDQWIRIGAARAADALIVSGQSRPFIIVFPDNHYWRNASIEKGFGDRLVNDVIPYIDATYRTLPDRNHRAIGGLSRGAGWSLQLGLSEWELFGAVGLHSLAVIQKDGSRIEEWIDAIPPASRPQVFMDIGDADRELTAAQKVETLFNDSGIPHEWHLYNGAHTEEYWSAHVDEYMRWYAEQWNTPQ